MRFRWPFVLFLALALVSPPSAAPTAGVGTAATALPVAAAAPAVLNNPIVSTGSPDPFIHKGRDGFYYMLSTNASKIVIRKAPSIAGIDQGAMRTVWTAPSSGPNSRSVWAPELHFIDKVWYIYFAAGDGGPAGQRLWVLANSAADPLEGTWLEKGRIDEASDRWAIDGTVLRQNGSSYLLWSGREDASDPRQHLYIAPLRTPWELGGPRVRIASPTHPWEGNVNEGPQVLRRNGRLFITFSANSCTSDDYALGLLTAAEGSDPLDPASWTKTPGPVFQKAVANGVYGPGHNGLTTSSDGTEDWLLYHANAGPGQGCGGLRITRAQKFSWHADGTPDFGTPACTCEALPLPAGERGASPLVANASFEAEGRADQTPRNWSTWVDEEVGVADAGADFVEAGGRSGSFAGVHRKGSDYQVATQQVVTALRNGTYTLRAWIQSSGGQEQARLYAAGYGGPGSWVDIPASAAWRQVAISGINVTAGRATIGFSSRSPGGRWLRFDDVELVKEPDLLQNASFQLDGPNTQEISGWKTWPGADGTGADADRVERGGHGGDYRAGHFKATDYQVGTYQTVTGLVNGRYTLSAWVRSSGGQEAAYLEVKDFGAPVRRVDIPGTNNWVQIVVRDIAVTNGQATVGFYSFSPGEKWLRFDDVEFYRQD